MKVQLDSEVPILYGVLNCLKLSQAEERCITDKTHGESLAISAIDVFHTKRAIESMSD